MDWKVQNELWLEQNLKNDPSIRVTTSGLQYKIIADPTPSDARPNKTSYVTCDYTLRLIFKQKNPETGVFFDGWALPYMKGGDANNQIPVYIHDGNAYFHQVSSAINDIEGEGAQVKSVQLYDVEGREILSPKDGQLVIEKQTLYNGKTKSFKRVAH